MSIFISIASYRDPQLVPTIRDCLTKARNPDALRFGICWQHGDEDGLPAEFADPRFRILDVHWRRSRGVCWARAEIMKLWQGETYFLQIDLHQRFAPDWDAKLIDFAQRTCSAKPALSTYAAPFVSGEAERLEGEPEQIHFNGFTPDGVAPFKGHPIGGWMNLTRPVRARFLSAGFLFTIGDFVNDVPYDPELYFLGEEITLTIRAFTHGYDLFHPPENVIWHEYARTHAIKHWDDHVAAHGVEVEWRQRETASRRRVRRFLTEPHVGPFGCGRVRSFAEYEAYAGLDFRHKLAQDYTLRGGEPPNPPAGVECVKKVRAWHVRIEFDRTALPAAALVDPLFWYVGFHDAENEEIHRQDAAGEELRALLVNNATRLAIDRRFSSDRRPVSWTVWPVSRSAGWLDKITARVEGTGLESGHAEPQGQSARDFAGGGVGRRRNDICPCGSGKKFKHCHGRWE